ncbi:MAG: MBL fold metallo-hydrolase [Candidatus Omnitrophica bacterium]|nr:MBL fold metallo-hydrolase [Candidatus Omnitrophota bacterium]
MSLVFERVVSKGIGDISYVIGDEASGLAAVIDPRPDCDAYIQLAREHNVTIRHIIQTHIHEDFVSGVRQLAAGVGNAIIHAGHSDEDTYGYELDQLREGDKIDLGSISLTARNTPGHTPEHIAVLIHERSSPDDPYAVFTGGSLLVNAVGRSDLLGQKRFEEMLHKQYDTLTNVYAKLSGGVIIHPTHGYGSACGPAIGDRFSSTIGYEHSHNPYMKCSSFGEFKDLSVRNTTPRPTYYPRLKITNTQGARIENNTPIVPGCTAKEFEQLIRSKQCAIVDTRSMLEFGGGHIADAINIEDKGELSVWAGWMLDPEQPLAIVLRSDHKLDEVVSLFRRTGFTNILGYLVGGMGSWVRAGLTMDHIRQIDVHELYRNHKTVQVLDVRSPLEWKSGHIPNAKHIYLPDLPKHMGELDKKVPVATYCNTGYRASIASSLLKQAGFLDVKNVPGSWKAWIKAELPIEK